MYVCICHSVTDKQIRKAASNGVDSFAALQEELKVGTCCGKCQQCARKVLNAALDECMAPMDELLLATA